MMTHASRPSPLIETLTLVLCLGLAVTMLLLPEWVRLDLAEDLASVVTEPYDWVVRNARFIQDMQRRAAETRALQSELELKSATLERALRDYERLTTPLTLPPGFEGTLIPCQVITRQSGRQATMIMIRSEEPVAWRNYQSVVTSTGLLGRVEHFKLGSRRAWVALLTAPDMALGCEVERSGIIGVLRSYGNKFVLDLVSRDETDIAVGDRVITSGIAEVPQDSAQEEGWCLSPRGLPVGTVSRITRSTAHPFLDIEVKPLASLRANTTVFLVLPAGLAAGTGGAGSGPIKGGER
jgi:cell shape-determining protein MreC